MAASPGDEQPMWQITTLRSIAVVASCGAAMLLANRHHPQAVVIGVAIGIATVLASRNVEPRRPVFVVSNSAFVVGVYLLATTNRGVPHAIGGWLMPIGIAATVGAVLVRLQYNPDADRTPDPENLQSANSPHRDVDRSNTPEDHERE